MGEGFFEADGSNEMEAMGEDFINVLLRNSLLQIAERDVYGNVESCVMHDLLHDLATSILRGSFREDEITRVRYVFLKDDSSAVLKNNAKYLRTLLFKDKINGNMFSNFESLHVLTFGSREVEELSNEIKKLIHLRVLDIEQTSIEYLPDWIGELFHLQTLRACSYRLKQLPSTLKNLRNLRHLYIEENVELSAEIGLLTSLRTLKIFRVGDKNGYKIEELGSLNCLKGKLQIDNLEMVRNKEEAEKANLSNKPKLLELYLGWKIGRQGETTNDENVLEGLQPHSRLKNLVISGFGGRSFPSWTRNMEVDDVGQGSRLPLTKLVKITLSDCSECEEIPMFGQLLNLKCLRLYKLRNVKSINSSFYGSVNDETRTVFPVLEELVLKTLPKLTVLKGIESVGASAVSVFPHLQHLTIEDCGVLTRFPTHFWSSLKCLNIFRNRSYKPLADIFQAKLTLLTELWIDVIDDVESLPDWLFYSNPNLSKFTIEQCSNLREIPAGLGTLNSLKELRITDCPNLKRIGDLGVNNHKKVSDPLQLCRSVHARLCCIFHVK
ncbi:putative disease resistance protein RGA3 [Salvia hispanica]|uniref:putative disease resistance protein RGA3 n=1 Tax=Salvia hispanica TaxID=49212 RepID=UPI002009C3BA|nr:putative disease resistance protein RGA3 [Salvia hispanica]